MRQLPALRREQNNQIYNVAKISFFPTLLIYPDTSLKFVNDAFQKLTGFSSRELIGKKIPYPWWLQERLEVTRENFFKSLKTGEQEDTYQTRDGKLFYVRAKVMSLLKNGKPEYYFSDWLDVTSQNDLREALKSFQDQMDRSYESYTKLTAENVKLEKQLSKQKEIKEQLILSKEKLAKLTSHIQAISEAERSSMAREIHDEMGQSLTALKLESSWILEHTDEKQEQIRAKLQLILGIIDSTIKKVKSLSTRLRPRILDDLGIAAAIEWKIKDFQGYTGIKCDIQNEPGEICLDKDAATALFRVFQEAFTNIIRHSNATAVKVKLMTRNNRVILKIKDNGIGITKEQIQARESLGIIGMIERIRALDGEVKFKGIQNRGTTIFISLPLEKEAKVID